MLLTVLNSVSGQVRIRLFADYQTDYLVFRVHEGSYLLNLGNSRQTISEKDPVIIMKYNNKLAVRTKDLPGFICDSLTLYPASPGDVFSVNLNTGSAVKQFYSGEFICRADLGTIVIINNSGVENYIAGVVQAEGGPGKHIEYLKTQAVIARTYMYRYFSKHLADHYNLCDDTHCQAFKGLASDTAILRAVAGTRGMVILDRDSSLVIAAFHSNCGGETVPSEDVWLTGTSYLKRIVDPYCTDSRNARWLQNFSLNEWKSYLKSAGYGGEPDTRMLNFSQYSRKKEYSVGTFSIPLNKLREDLKLRSTYFSLTVEGDSVKLTGRGYGHGAGLCQEGAMVMAQKGFTFRQIIDFYYQGVVLADYSIKE